MFKELKLGAISIFKMADGITNTETGLVSGQQVASYVEEKLSAGGSTGSWNGGTVTKPTTFNADVSIGHGPPVWLIYRNTNAGHTWNYIPGEAVPTKDQINEFVNETKLARPASGNIGQYLQLTASGPSWSDPPSNGTPSVQGNVNYYENASSPGDWPSHCNIPVGWYKVEVMLTSANGGDAAGILNSSAVSEGNIKNVMGLAWGGTDNSSCPYTTFDGITWMDMCGSPVSRPMASILQISFYYKHTRPLRWPGSHLGYYSDWNLGSVRYTEILPPEDIYYMSTAMPTEAPTEPPTIGPTSPPTSPPTEPPTEGPTQIPSQIPSQIPLIP